MKHPQVLQLYLSQNKKLETNIKFMMEVKNAIEIENTDTAVRRLNKNLTKGFKYDLERKELERNSLNCLPRNLLIRVNTNIFKIKTDTSM